jgi:hypothetical protein
MTRRRYIQDRHTGELIEVSQDYRAPLPNDAGVLWGDRHYDGARATDGTDISTRTKHREYMAARGLTLADDYKNTWANAQAQREAYFRAGGSIRREDVARAIHDVSRRR